MTETRVFAHPADLAEAAALWFATTIEASVRERQRALVCLAGGSTPRACYAALARLLHLRRRLVERVTWMLGDERWVTVGHPESNEGMVRRELLDPLNVADGSVLSWQAGSGDPVDCAARYAAAALAAGRSDLLILGIGADGHTASLFPDAEAWLPGGRRLPVGPELPAAAAAVLLAGGAGWRLTLCPMYLTRARRVAYLAAGAGKRDALERAVRGDPATPAAWIRGEDTLFLVDRAAAPLVAGGTLPYA